MEYLQEQVDEHDGLDPAKEGDECPNCGRNTGTWRNSSGELQCDNCGYDETNDEEDIEDYNFDEENDDH